MTFTGEDNNDQYPAWFANRAHAQHAFDRSATGVQDFFDIGHASSPSPNRLSSMQTRDRTAQELKVGAPKTSVSTIPLLQKLQLEQKPKDPLRKRPTLAAKASPPPSKKVKDRDISSQENEDFGDDIPIEDLDALLAMTNVLTPTNNTNPKVTSNYSRKVSLASMRISVLRRMNSY